MNEPAYVPGLSHIRLVLELRAIFLLLHLLNFLLILLYVLKYDD